MPSPNSVYERRDFGWRDRLRRLFGREEDHTASPIIVDKNGEPQLVTSHGRLIGLRREDGTVAPVPERRIEEVPDSEWTWIGGEWRERWRE